MKPYLQTLMGVVLTAAWIPSAPVALAAPNAESELVNEDTFEDTEGEDERELEAITVTVQKRRENLQDVPTSVATVSNERISILRSSGQDIRSLAGRLPSLNVESSFGRSFPRFYIRGLGNTDFDLNASQPVSLIVDEVYLENPIVKSFPLFDLERVELLRGPQGTLFGRNTPAGAIKVETAKPTDELEVIAKISGGERGFFGAETAVSGSLIDDVLTARVSGMFERQSDWIDNTQVRGENNLGGFTQSAARLQLQFTPHESVDALLNVHAHELRGTARVFRANVIQPGTDELIEDFDRAEVSQDGQNEQTLSQWGASFKLSVDLGEAFELTSVSAYEYAETFSRADVDGGFGAINPDNPIPTGPPPGIPFTAESADALPAAHQFTQELRLSTQDWDVVNFVLGAYYFYEDLEIESYSFDTLAGGVENGFATQSQETQAIGLFQSTTVQFVDWFKVQLGLRWSHDEKDFTAQRLQSPLAFLGAGPLGPLSASPSADFLSGDLSVSVYPMKRWMVYGRFARGFRAPSIQGRILFGDEVSQANEESINSFELGTKTQLLAWLRANLTGYVYIIEDQQLTAVGGDANFNRLVNADETVGYGAEFELSASPLAGLFLSMGLSLNQTQINDETLSVETCASCVLLDPRVNPDSDEDRRVFIDGNSLANAPEVMLQLDARYGVDVSDALETYIYTDWSYRSRTRFFLYESEEFQDDGILEGGIRLGVRTLNDRYDLAVFVRNILNDTSRTGGIDFNNLTGFVNSPRFVGAELRIQL